MNTHLSPVRIVTGPTEPMVFHEIANAFPMLGNTDFWELVEDIRTRGVREPIVMFEGRVLDGRNRYLAAREAGVEYPVADYIGDDPVNYVASLNLKRRHLTRDERRMIAGRLAELGRGRPPKDENRSIRPIIPTQRQAAEMTGSDEMGVKRARAIITGGVPELVAMVDAGEVSVNRAAELARLPAQRQREAVAGGKDGIRQAVHAMRDAAFMEMAKQAASTAEPDEDEVESPPSVVEVLREVEDLILCLPEPDEVAATLDATDIQNIGLADLSLTADWLNAFLAATHKVERAA